MFAFMLNNVGYIWLNYKPNEGFETYIIHFKGEKELFLAIWLIVCIHWV
jgi:hypothetical protein